jgi:YHS domain-containing protein
VLLRLILFIVFAIVVARAFWRLVDGVVAGISGRPRGGTSVQSTGVAMVRDPICGTFVLPDPSRMITDGRTQVFFCSNACRDRYRASRGSDGRARTA